MIFINLRQNNKIALGSDIVYDQTINKSFHEKLESVQYKTATYLVNWRFFQELGLETLKP